MPRKDLTPTENNLSKWRRNRFATFVIFSIEVFVMGIVYSFGISTYWTYITLQLKPDKPYLVYGLMTYLHYLPTMLFGLVITNLHDKYRETKFFLVIINFITFIGAIMYTIDFSKYFPIIGCLLMGVRYLAQPVAVGELARSYKPEELTYKLPILNFFCYLSIGPASIINFVSEKISFSIGPLNVRYGNFHGIIVAVLYIFLMFLVIRFVHNLSLDFDLKEYLQQKTIISKDISEKYSEEECLLPNNASDPYTSKEKDIKETSILNSLKRLVSNPDVMLMYFLVWLFNYMAYFSFAYIPLLIQNELQYDARYVNGFYLGHTVLLLVFLPVIIFLKTDSKTSFYIGLASYVLMLIIVFCFRAISIHQTTLFNTALLLIILVLYAIIYTCEDIFLMCTIAKFVKPDIQSFADGIRAMMRNLGSATGCLSVPFFLKHKDVFYIFQGILLLIAIVMMLFRKSVLQNPNAVV